MSIRNNRIIMLHLKGTIPQGFSSTNRNKECLAEASFGSFGSRARFGINKKANIPHANGTLHAAGRYLP